MLRRLASLALAAVFAFALSGKAQAQAVNVDFDAFVVGTAVEALAAPGVTFAGTPPGPWQVATGGFATFTGNHIIANGGYAVLTATFAQPQFGYRFNFATNGPATLRVTGFLGGTQVFSQTFTGSIPPGVAFPEGIASGGAANYDSLVITTDESVQVALDNLAAGAAVASIPTLSEWGLAILAALMVLGVGFRLRARAG